MLTSKDIKKNIDKLKKEALKKVPAVQERCPKVPTFASQALRFGYCHLHEGSSGKQKANVDFWGKWKSEYKEKFPIDMKKKQALTLVEETIETIAKNLVRKLQEENEKKKIEEEERRKLIEEENGKKKIEEEERRKLIEAGGTDDTDDTGKNIGGTPSDEEPAALDSHMIRNSGGAKRSSRTPIEEIVGPGQTRNRKRPRPKPRKPREQKVRSDNIFRVPGYWEKKRVRDPSPGMMRRVKAEFPGAQKDFVDKVCGTNNYNPPYHIVYERSGAEMIVIRKTGMRLFGEEYSNIVIFLDPKATSASLVNLPDEQSTSGKHIVRWMANYSDTDGENTMYMLNFLRLCRPVFFACRRDDDHPYVLLGIPGDLRVRQTLSLTVQENDTVYQFFDKDGKKEKNGHIHKEKNLPCIPRSMGEFTLKPVKISPDLMWESRAQLCPQCCFTQIVADFVFEKIEEDGLKELKLAGFEGKEIPGFKDKSAPPELDYPVELMGIPRRVLQQRCKPGERKQKLIDRRQAMIDRGIPLKKKPLKRRPAGGSAWWAQDGISGNPAGQMQHQYPGPNSGQARGGAPTRHAPRVTLSHGRLTSAEYQRRRINAIRDGKQEVRKYVFKVEDRSRGRNKGGRPSTHGRPGRSQQASAGQARSSGTALAVPWVRTRSQEAGGYHDQRPSGGMSAYHRSSAPLGMGGASEGMMEKKSAENAAHPTCKRTGVSLYPAQGVLLEGRQPLVKYTWTTYA